MAPGGRRSDGCSGRRHGLQDRPPAVRGEDRLRAALRGAVWRCGSAWRCDVATRSARWRRSRSASPASIASRREPPRRRRRGRRGDRRPARAAGGAHRRSHRARTQVREIAARFRRRPWRASCARSSRARSRGCARRSSSSRNRIRSFRCASATRRGRFRSGSMARCRRRSFWRRWSRDYGVGVVRTEPDDLHRASGRHGRACRVHRRRRESVLCDDRLPRRAGRVRERHSLQSRARLLPLAFYRAIEETVHETLAQGLCGWEVTDCIVTLTQAGFWSPVSTAADFRKLTPLVLMQALLNRRHRGLRAGRRARPRDPGGYLRRGLRSAGECPRDDSQCRS